MTFDSDAELKDHVRGQVGVNQSGDLPERVLDEELQRGKAELNTELKERLNNGQSLAFYDSKASDQRALEHFLLIRAKVHALQQQRSRGETVTANIDRNPATIATIRRFDYGDQTLNHWRDRMVTHLNNITV